MRGDSRIDGGRGATALPKIGCDAVGFAPQVGLAPRASREDADVVSENATKFSRITIDGFAGIWYHTNLADFQKTRKEQK